MSGFMANVLGPFIITCTDMWMLCYLCHDSSKYARRLWWIYPLFSLCLFCIRPLQAMQPYDVLYNYPIAVLKYLLFSRLYTNAPLAKRIYLMAGLIVGCDLCRVLLGRASFLLFGLDYLMYGSLPLYLGAHALLFFIKFSLMILIRRQAEIISGSIESSLSLAFTILPVLPFLLMRDYMRLMGQQPADISAAYFAFIVVSGLCALLCIFAGGRVLHESHQAKLRFMEGLMRKQHEQYVRSDAASKAARRAYHDLHYILRAILAMESIEGVREYIHTIEGGIESFSAGADTGNAMMDVVLNEKIQHCKAHGIDLEVRGDGRGWERVHGADIAVLFGNALDNAIENLPPERERAYVRLRVGRVEDMLAARFENPYAHPLQRGGEGFISTKEDAKRHGYGLESIGLICKKYGGEMSIKTEEERFVLSVLIPAGPGEELAAKH